MTPAVVHHGYGHLSHHLIVIYPRLENGIEQRNEQKEDEHTLVSHHHLKLFPPYIGYLFNTFSHRFAFLR